MALVTRTEADDKRRDRRPWLIAGLAVAGVAVAGAAAARKLASNDED
jgi:hypothetical protein